jgi:hypothetical protein
MTARVWARKRFAPRKDEVVSWFSGCGRSEFSSSSLSKSRNDSSSGVVAERTMAKDMSIASKKNILRYFMLCVLEINRARQVKCVYLKKILKY